MKISTAIKKLQKILKNKGDLKILIDVEAGTFPCQYVDTVAIVVMESLDHMENLCIFRLRYIEK